MKEPSFSYLEPGQIELDCGSDEPYERVVRFLVRSKYGEMEPVTADDLPEIRGYTRVRKEPSMDLLRLARALQFAQKRANERGLTKHQRILRHNEVDALADDVRYLMNVEAGEKYSEYDLELRGCGQNVSIAVAVSRGRRR